MAITQEGLTHWNVVDTGSLASAHVDNGGAFWVGGSGTDKTNGAPTIYTDLVIDAVTNTNITSAASPFGASDVGNYINVTGGVGFTVARYRIVSVAGVIATCDAAVGVVASVAGTGRLGGALPSPGQAGAAIGANLNQRIWLRGTHLKTVNTNNVDGGILVLTESSIIYGYTATRGDASHIPTSTMLPVINSNAIAGTAVIASGNSTKIIGIRFELGTGYRGGGSSTGLNSYEGCYVNGGGIAVNSAEDWVNCVIVVNNAANTFDPRSAHFTNCTFLMSAIRIVGAASFTRCTFIRSDAGEILANTGADRSQMFSQCTFVTANGYCVDTTIGATRETFIFDRCLFYTVSAQACVRSGDGSPGRMYRCAYNVAPSNSGGYPFVNDNPVVLAADPFTNRAGGDYSLTATAIAALRLSGSTVGGLPATSTIDWIGAMPISAASAGGSGRTYIMPPIYGYYPLVVGQVVPPEILGSAVGTVFDTAGTYVFDSSVGIQHSMTFATGFDGTIIRKLVTSAGGTPRLALGR